jgi:hypothetical protein
MRIERRWKEVEGKTTPSTSENACIYGSFRHIGERWKVIYKKVGRKLANRLKIL